MITHQTPSKQMALAIALMGESCIVALIHDLAFQGRANGLSSKEIASRTGLSDSLGCGVANAVVERILMNRSASGGTYADAAQEPAAI